MPNQLFEKSLESIRDQIDQLIVENKKLQNSNHYEVISEDDLRDKEKMVIDYVTKNPGTTKQGVVDALKGKYSRGPIFNAIEGLQKLGIIVVRKDTANPQIHHLYINDDSLLLSAAQEFESVKNNFSDLINKVKSRQGEWKDNKDYNYLTPILIIYAHIIVTHTLSSIFIWPKKTKDRELLHRLYVIGFARMQEIQLKLLEIISNDAGIMRSVLLSLFVLTPQKLSAVYEILCKYNLSREGEPVLDSLWQICQPLIPVLMNALLSPYTYLPEEREQIMKKSESWRELVNLVQRRWKEREIAQTKYRRPDNGEDTYRSNMPWPRL